MEDNKSIDKRMERNLIALKQGRGPAAQIAEDFLRRPVRGKFLKAENLYGREIRSADGYVGFYVGEPEQMSVFKAGNANESYIYYIYPNAQFSAMTEPEFAQISPQQFLNFFRERDEIRFPILKNGAKMVFVINEAAEPVVRELTKNVPARFVSSLDPVKREAKKIGWNGQMDDKGIELLERLKMALLDYNDMPASYLIKMTEDFKKSRDSLLFVMVDDPEIINAYLSQTDLAAATIYLNTPGNTPIPGSSYDYEINSQNGLMPASLDMIHAIKSALSEHKLLR